MFLGGYGCVTKQDGRHAVTIRVAWLASVGGFAFSPQPLLHTTPSVSRAWVVGLKLAPNPASAYRWSQGAEHTFDLGGWASRHFTEVPTWRPASTELEPSEPDRAPDLIGAYGRRTSNTSHVPFTSFRIEWTSGASAPECGVAPEVEMAVMWAALPRSGTCGRLGDHKMGGSDASRLYLRSGAASGVTPLG